MGREFGLYLLASAAALALDTSTLTLGLALGLSLPLAASAGFLLGLLLVYALSTRHIFQRHRLASRRAEFLGFALIGLAGLAATQGLLWLATGTLGLAVLPAKALSAGGVFMLNFSLRKWLLFMRPAETNLT